MADNTPKTLRNQMMYQVFVRNYSEAGTFAQVEHDLDRIKALGTDIVWLMPIHPIGKAQRKGTLGSPYAISDYRAVNPEFGTLDDFKSLVAAIHSRGMKCIIDVVYNHTSPDSVLSREHPEWFYHKPDGSFGNRVGDWSDIIDLDYSNKELWRYQIDTLKMWAELVDGFRCDVAPLIPIAFWEQARREVASVRPDAVWLSESVEPGFILYIRAQGMTALSDSEIYRAFDLSYDYDCYGSLRDWLYGKGSLRAYAEAVNRQEYTYPDNYVKLRFLENHDQTRARFFLPDLGTLRSMTAFLFFQKGMPLVYAGQEKAVSHLPSLFDKDTVQWDGEETFDLSPLICKLAQIRKDPVFTDSTYHVTAVGEDTLVATHESGEKRLTGVFPLSGRTAFVPVDLPDGSYTDLLGGGSTEVFRGGVTVRGEALILAK